ncbi:galactosyl transferase GMA12/MNN10 family-domain-containing protein [Dichotomocladium elegans]|nr:galactosyl transferase GMA12/MNN10 family-domain-containing protein [Dichotomocladium elegans]
MDDDNVIINDSNHYTYLVVVASPPDQMARRSLIREKYFGLANNLLPCMRFNSDTMYTFWIYGRPIPARTAERRKYEAEKMEWNDLEEVPARMTFSQADVLEWAETTLAERGVTYDYLIVQDIYTFAQLSVIRRELESGVLSENTPSSVNLGLDSKSLIWATFTGEEVDNDAFVIGSDAAKLALKYKDDITAAAAAVGSGKSKRNLLTDMYTYFQSESVEGENPIFVREDDAETHRFIRWENNVESVHTEDCIVSRVYQDSEFIELAQYTFLQPTPACYPRNISEATTEEQQLPSIALMTSSYIYDDNCMEPSATLAAMNKRKYAERHGHSFVARSAEFAQQRGRKTVWGKVDAVEKVLPKYDWIFWMDMDAVIMNADRSLHELLDDLKARYPGGPDAFDANVDLIAAKPRKDPMLNAGVFYLKNTAWSRKFLRDVQGVTEWYTKGPSYEQGAMWKIMTEPENEDHVFVLVDDDHTMNTFPQRYQPGDFIVHFAPDKCPNELTLKGLAAAERIENGESITFKDIM